MSTGPQPRRSCTFAASAAALLLLAAPLDAQRPELAPAVQLFDRGQFAEAKPLFVAAAQRDPRNAEAHYYLGRVAMHDGALADATRALERATALDATRSVYFEWLGNAYGLQARRANVLKQAGLARKTIGAWDRAVALDPGNLDARANRMQYYLEAPGFLGGSEDKAVAEAAEIRRRDPYRGALATAVLHERKKRYADAERTYLDAIRQFPDSLGLRYRLGFGYQAIKQWDKAFAVWDDLLRVRPGEAGALYQVGRTGALSGQRLDRAEQALREYLRTTRGPTDPPAGAAHYRLGMVLEQRGDRAGARTEYEAALRLDPAHKDAKAALKKLE
jgi:tetratricopeptide (TPR) repeat protein